MRLRAVAVALALVAGLSASASAQSSDVEVTPGESSYDGEIVVRGEDGSATSVGGGGSCDGCVWRLVPDCPGNAPPQAGPDGAIQPGGDEMCSGASVGCPSGQVHFRVYRKRPGESFEHVSTICLGGGRDVVSTAAIRAEVDRYLTTMPLPLPGLHVQPHGPSVVGVPAIFYADPPATVTDTFGPLGLRVRIVAVPVSWLWEPQAGVSFVTDGPGAPYPRRDVTHAYTALGRYTARVTATWSGSYAIAGIDGQLPVRGTVRRTSTTVLEVREARSELVQGDD